MKGILVMNSLSFTPIFTKSLKVQESCLLRTFKKRQSLHNISQTEKSCLEMYPARKFLHSKFSVSANVDVVYVVRDGNLCMFILVKYSSLQIAP